MEKEINQLKKEYDQASPPIFLVENGTRDLWRRVNNQNKYYNSKIFKYVLLGMLVLLISSGLIGAISTQASANSALYPVKILTEKAVSTISNATLDTINKSKEIINKNTQPTTVSPTPAVILEEKQKDIEEKEEDEKEIQNENQERELEQEHNSKSEEVKGESTSELNKDEDSSRSSREDNEGTQKKESD